MPATVILFLEGVILSESGALKFREFGAVLGILSLELTQFLSLGMLAKRSVMPRSTTEIRWQKLFFIDSVSTLMRCVTRVAVER